MTTPDSTAKILIATDIVADAVLVKEVLSKEFDHVVISTDPDAVAGDFVRHQPDVLVLAFNELEKSERYYLSLYHLYPEVHRHPEIKGAAVEFKIGNLNPVRVWSNRYCAE